MEKNITEPIAIPEEIREWIDETADKTFPVIYLAISAPRNSRRNQRSFTMGAEAMYRRLSPELEALRKERDAYRECLNEIRKNDLIPYGNTSLMLAGPIARKISKVFDQYPPSIVIDKTENNENKG